MIERLYLMANSLRAKLSKLRHDGKITDNEYQKLIKKLDGHDKQIRADAIDDFHNLLYSYGVVDIGCYKLQLYIEDIPKIINQLRGE